ncbi:MAG: methionyl-tRNA formyltransferase [Luteolibacter sp.]
MRLIFVATGDIALPSFRHLLAHGPRPLALVTQPDKPVGRHQTLTPPRIKVEAQEAGVPVYQPEKIGDATEELAALNPEILVVMAYGQFLPKVTRELPSQAIINLHASILPKYRGASCIQAAIDHGDAESGITVMHVVRQLDAGDIILVKALPISADETGGTLHDRLADLAPDALAEALDQLADGTATRTPQIEAEHTYAPKLEREHGKLDWSLPASALERRIRAYDPWPGTYTLVIESEKEKRLKIFPPTQVMDRLLSPGEIRIEDGQFIVGCGEKALRLESIQPEGGKRMTITDYLRGKTPERMKID